MKLLLGSDETIRTRLRSIRQMPAGPGRLQKYLKLLQDDADRLPSMTAAPEPVQEACAALSNAVHQARQILDELKESRQDVTRARETDVETMMTAMKEGKRSKRTEPQAREKVDTSEVAIEAAEKLLIESHTALISTAKQHWASWRRGLVFAAEGSQEQARKSYQEAVSAISTAREAAGSIGALDQELIRRFPNVADEVLAEQRSGIPWYQATHGGPAPLSKARVAVDDNKTRTLPLASVVDAVGAALEPEELPVLQWAPPGDPARDQLQAQPLPDDLPGLLRLVRERDGGECQACGRVGTDVVAETGDGGLVAVHKDCRDNPRLAAKRREATERSQPARFA